VRTQEVGLKLYQKKKSIHGLTTQQNLGLTTQQNLGYTTQHIRRYRTWRSLELEGSAAYSNPYSISLPHSRIWALLFTKHQNFGYTRQHARDRTRALPKKQQNNIYTVPRSRIFPVPYIRILATQHNRECGLHKTAHTISISDFTQLQLTSPSTREQGLLCRRPVLKTCKNKFTARHHGYEL
jgi:hypothetical protein